MPRTKSAKKALRQNVRRRTRNLAHRSKLKEVVKEYRKFVTAGKLEEARSFLPKVYKALDKTVKTGLIKKGRADRIKSRLTKKLVAAGK